MKKIFSIFVILFISVITLTITGCEKELTTVKTGEDIEIKQTSQDVQRDIENRITDLVENATDDKKLQDEMKKELRYIIQHKTIKWDNVRIDYNSMYKDFEYIDGDQAVSRDWVEESMKYEEKLENQGSLSTREHRRADYFVTAGTKTVYIHTSVPSGWASGLIQAIDAWNDLGLTVKFTSGGWTSNTYNYGAITVFMWDLSGAYADAYDPYANGNPGKAIRIDYGNDGLSTSQKKFILAHELGHTIGFKHTNTSEGYSLTTSGYSCIPFGCNGTNSGSVMRVGSTPPPSWVAFSYCDQEVFKCIY